MMQFHWFHVTRPDGQHPRGRSEGWVGPYSLETPRRALRDSHVHGDPERCETTVEAWAWDKKVWGARPERVAVCSPDCAACASGEHNEVGA